MPRPLEQVMLSLLVCALWCPPGASAQIGDAAGPAPARTIELRSHSGLADAMYQSQLLGPLDHAVGSGITLCGTRIPARVTTTGDLELDLLNRGTFHRVGVGITTVSVPDAVNKKTLTVKLYLSKASDGVWRYRNVTQISFAIGEDIVSVIDVNGDGIYNQSGVDGMCWDGETQVFPLPAPTEHWCTRHAELTALSFTGQGQHAKVVRRDLATVVPETLALLQNINEERVRLGLTPRPENVDLSAALQSHCQYMVGTSVLAHPETPGTPGYTAAGNEAGLNAILGQGTPVELVATVMMSTFYHRMDVVRPTTHAFGLGHAGSFSGIDGRRDLDAAMTVTWPVLCPAPDEQQVALAFSTEMPDPLPGVTSAGYPITAYFADGGVTITSAILSDILPASTEVLPCTLFDSAQGGVVDFNRYQHVAGMIPRAVLLPGHTYQVQLAVTTPAGPWSRSWRFSTTGGREAPLPH